jgi:hypothetical protein
VVPYDRGVAVERTTGMRARQAVAIVVGIVFFAFGGITLAQAGFTPLFQHVQVLGLHHTPLMGIIELAFGLFMMGIGAVPGANRTVLVFLGALATGFGIVGMASGNALHRSLGMHTENGVLYLIVGLGCLLVGLFVGRAPAPMDEAPPEHTHRYPPP